MPVPLVRQPLPASLAQADSAAGLFGALRQRLPGVPMAFLDSSDHSHTPRPERSRYSILAFSFGPQATTVQHRSRREFLSWLTHAWDTPHDVPHAAQEDPAFQLGWVGVLGYEYRTQFFYATHAVVVDHHTGTAELQSLGEGSGWVEAVTQALQLAQSGQLAQSRQDVLHTNAAQAVAPGVLRQLRARDSQAEYLGKIAAAQEQIRRGNTYEVCLTTAVNGSLTADPWQSYLQLRAQNPAPFTQYLQLPGSAFDGEDTVILSTSPERFVQVSSAGLIRSEPIKGTRRRHLNPDQDAAAADDLRAHPKDRAENVMIADLVRNDLSIHAAPGTLRTERLCAVETYATVHQMVSTISAQLEPGASRARAVCDAFPPGSMTGAPKGSTMQILQDLESGPRGPYSGVAGYFSSTGACDLSVLIRAAVLTAGEPGRWDFHLGLGGAITADSEPQAEWEEILTKSRGVLGALGAEFPTEPYPC
ncbi:anthranilate synthase component I family protein [Nesterenkonia rhizosphaerae]|uniref:Chorismate-utilising enzyme C-terminal domain-containing protein n=1 Tax=Nesterenkonia rhizosphaerae TaxID=1348272 RepID=A0ABP9FWJ1_9MICC